jgi:hypothetical protein
MDSSRIPVRGGPDDDRAPAQGVSLARCPVQGSLETCRRSLRRDSLGSFDQARNRHGLEFPVCLVDVPLNSPSWVTELDPTAKQHRGPLDHPCDCDEDRPAGVRTAADRCGLAAVTRRLMGSVSPAR